MSNHHEKYWTIWACVLIFPRSLSKSKYVWQVLTWPILDKSSDTLKSCERDVRRLQRSKETNGWSCWITWQKDGMCSTPTWLIHTQGVWSATRKISPIPITDDKTYLYICTCTYLYDMYIYIPVYNVSIYIFTCNHNNFVLNQLYTWEIEKNFENLPTFSTSPVRSTFSRCQQGKGEDHGNTWSYEPKDFPDHRQGRSFRVVCHAIRRVGDCLYKECLRKKKLAMKLTRTHAICIGIDIARL